MEKDGILFFRCCTHLGRQWRCHPSLAVLASGFHSQFAHLPACHLKSHLKGLSSPRIDPPPHAFSIKQRRSLRGKVELSSSSSSSSLKFIKRFSSENEAQRSMILPRSRSSSFFLFYPYQKIIHQKGRNIFLNLAESKSSRKKTI